MHKAENLYLFSSHLKKKRDGSRQGVAQGRVPSLSYPCTYMKNISLNASCISEIRYGIPLHYSKKLRNTQLTYKLYCFSF